MTEARRSVSARASSLDVSPVSLSYLFCDCHAPGPSVSIVQTLVSSIQLVTIIGAETRATGWTCPPIICLGRHDR